MAKSLLLHIGANKTGSTAIQDFLQINAVALRQQGIVVAPADLSRDGRVTGRHVRLIKTLLADIDDGQKQIDAALARLMAELPQHGRLVISAENLALSHYDPSNSPGELTAAHWLFANAVREYDTRIILYVRRQDELLLSSWQQWQSKISTDFWAWMLAAAGVEGDWQAVLSTWETLVPRAHITVRRYERARFPNGDIIPDFAALLGLGGRLGDFRRPPSNANPSYGATVTAFAGANLLLFRDAHDNQFYRTVEALTGSRFHRDPRESPLTRAQRLAVLERYATANEWVLRAYFPDDPAPLFAPPRAEDYDAPAAGPEEGSRWDLAASLAFGLAKQPLA